MQAARWRSSGWPAGQSDRIQSLPAGAGEDCTPLKCVRSAARSLVGDTEQSRGCGNVDHGVIDELCDQAARRCIGPYVRDAPLPCATEVDDRLQRVGCRASCVFNAASEPRDPEIDAIIAPERESREIAADVPRELRRYGWWDRDREPLLEDPRDQHAPEPPVAVGTGESSRTGRG